MKNERRQFRRFKHQDAVRIQRKDPINYHGALSHDISRKGLKVDVPYFIPLGAELFLAISMEQQPLIECRGQVVWVEKRRYSDHYMVGIELNERCDLIDIQ
ncbi:MAG: PilZ domain-containing protein [Candidatus Omnitrophica bacterium]|nr:PilZ domain-containing protein [Candidatus Omnitrophota bacterium]